MESEGIRHARAACKILDLQTKTLERLLDALKKQDRKQ